jgi:ComEC/Rec2-related protein
LKRARAVFRRRHPLAVFLAVFILGQVLGGFPGVTPLVCVVALGGVVALAAVSGREGVALGGLAVLGGIATVLVSLPVAWEGEADRSWRGEVVEAPRYPRTGEVRLVLKISPYGGGGGTGAFPVRTVACAAVDLPWRNIAGVVRGDTFVFRGVFTPVEAEFDPFAYGNTLLRRGISATCRITHATPVLRRDRSTIERLRAAIERGVAQVVGDGEMGGMVLSMSIGARDTLSLGTENAFKRTGTAHLLVVSGFQVTVVYYGVAWLVRWLLTGLARLGARVSVQLGANLGGVVASLLFVAIAWIDGASLRAALAAVFAAIGASLERGRGLIGGIGASMLGLVIVWPGSLLEPGVQLTYAALFGIAFGRDLLSPGGERTPLSATVGVTLGVWLLSSIVSLGWFRSFSPVGLILNPVISPLAGIVGCHGSFLGLAGYFSGIDRGGVGISAVGHTLIWVRDLFGYVAGSDLVLGELSAGWALGVALGLGAISAYLLHRRYQLSGMLRVASVGEPQRDGVFESPLSRPDRSATV